MPVAHSSHNARHHIGVLPLQYSQALLALFSEVLDAVQIEKLLICFDRVEEAIKRLVQAIDLTELLEQSRPEVGAPAAERRRHARHDRLLVGGRRVEQIRRHDQVAQLTEIDDDGFQLGHSQALRLDDCDAEEADNGLKVFFSETKPPVVRVDPVRVPFEDRDVDAFKDKPH